MLHTSNKTSVRGFTLIELLVVIAIIGLLSTIIAAPIQNARKKARDAKKIAELKSLQLAIEQFGESNDSNYPLTLAELSPGYMPLLPTFTSSSTSNQRDVYPYVIYTASSSGAQDQRFAYHLGAKLEVYGPALDTDRDCVFGIRGAALTDGHCAVYNGDNMISTIYDNGSLISAVGNATTSWGVYANGTDPSFGDDFYGGKPDVNPFATSTQGRDEDPESTCKNINDCIFDITSQQ